MVQNFRRSISGFNREDVVQYIEFINNRHAAQVNQLKTELATANEELAAAREKAERCTELETALEEVTAERDSLQVRVENADPRLQEELDAAREELATVKKQLEQTRVDLQFARSAEMELESYRRAERFERLARDRVNQLYAQANATLEQAAADSEDAAGQIGQIADSMTQQLGQMQTLLEKSKQTIRDTADAMKAIRPIDTEL